MMIKLSLFVFVAILAHVTVSRYIDQSALELNQETKTNLDTLVEQTGGQTETVIVKDQIKEEEQLNVETVVVPVQIEEQKEAVVDQTLESKDESANLKTKSSEVLVDQTVDQIKTVIVPEQIEELKETVVVPELTLETKDEIITLESKKSEKHVDQTDSSEFQEVDEKYLSDISSVEFVLEEIKAPVESVSEVVTVLKSETKQKSDNSEEFTELESTDDILNNDEETVSLMVKVPSTINQEENDQLTVSTAATIETTQTLVKQENDSSELQEVDEKYISNIESAEFVVEEIKTPVDTISEDVTVLKAEATQKDENSEELTELEFTNDDEIDVEVFKPTEVESDLNDQVNVDIKTETIETPFTITTETKIDDDVTISLTVETESKSETTPIEVLSEVKTDDLTVETKSEVDPITITSEIKTDDVTVPLTVESELSKVETIESAPLKVESESKVETIEVKTDDVTVPLTVEAESKTETIETDA